ncbi:MAG TPA: RNB domain-containing ribonuclease, partial [Minicystis sp.]|nr:RNB domain-containing ribonuclease [Minicystis sp.]
WLRTAAARLGAVRAARGGVSLAREEASVSLDPLTHEPTGVEPRTENEAHRLVERLMVAANEAVARWLVDRGLPGLFRVHERPTPDRVAQLASFAHNFGIEAGFGPELTPKGLAAFEAQYKGTAIEPAMRSVLGRLLGAARYTVHPSPHFGLAAPLYLHFTSPIRRYADLQVHRVVKRYLAGDRAMTAGEPAVEELGERVNRAAAAAAKAETERHRMLVARLFASRVGEVVLGHVVSVQPFGLVVQIEGTGATGTVALDALGEGPHAVDLAAQEVRSPARTWAVGEPFQAKIAATNEDLGRVDLVPA